MKIRTPKTSIFSSNSDRQNYAIDQALRKIRKIGLGSLAGAIGLLSVVEPTLAQNAITSLNASYGMGTSRTVNTTVASPANNSVGTSNSATILNFGSTTSNDLYIKTFDIPSKTFNFSGLVSNIYIRRNNTNFPSTNRQLAFFESNGTVNQLNSSYAPDMETILRSQTINRGTDNTFANQGNTSGNNSNVERIDFVTPAGLKAPTDPTQINDIGFLILERGGNDSVKIAAITGVDASGTPTSYGPVITQTSAQWGKVGPLINYTVMRKDASDADWRPSDKGNQQISGIYFSFGSLGVTAGQTIYGYSVIPADVNATGSGLLDWTTYPTNTPDSGTTGIDLMAGGGIFATHTISGTVFQDPNGSKLQDNGELGTMLSGGNALNAILIDTTGKVLQVSPVSAADGTYKFTGVAATSISGFPDTPYKIIITTAKPAVTSTAAVPITLPTGYVTTGENKSGVVDSVADGILMVSVSGIDPVSGQPTSTTTVGVNFGIEQLPTAKAVTVATQSNPGNMTSVNVPPGSFNTSTDPDGTVASYRITALPTNATSITIDATTYTSANFPAGGVTVLAANLNTIKVDPIDGAVTVQIPFKAIDNAGKESSNTATVSLPFTPSVFYSVAGNVFDDGNGTKVKDGSAENYTTANITAVLLDGTGNVVATAPINASGDYSLSSVLAGNYTVRIIQTPSTPLATNAVIPPASDTLPSNWVVTGENIGGTPDAVADRTLAVAVTNANVTGVNFGIEQLPTAVAVAVATQSNPGGSISVNVPPGSFNTSTDPDGTVASYRITALPTNATSITIDATTYTSANFPAGGVTVLAANLNTIKVDPIDGAVTVQIPFKAIDNAGKESTNIDAISLPFTASVVIAPPKLILLKRITKINGRTIAKAPNGNNIDLTTVVAQPDNPNTPEDESKDSTIDSSNAPTLTPWPAANYPQGAIDAGVIKTGDTIEYTIYFLSSGGKPVTNANLCDWVPDNTVFEPDSYGIGKGIQLAIGSIINTLTNVPDSDRGVFFNPGTILPTTYPTGSTSLLTCRTPAGSQGAVVVNLVKNTLPAPNDQLPNATAPGNPGNSYGFIRFVSKVK